MAASACGVVTLWNCRISIQSRQALQDFPVPGVDISGSVIDLPTVERIARGQPNIRPRLGARREISRILVGTAGHVSKC
jgi:hypothetical protein